MTIWPVYGLPLVGNVSFMPHCFNTQCVNYGWRSCFVLFNQKRHYGIHGFQWSGVVCVFCVGRGVEGWRLINKLHVWGQHFSTLRFFSAYPVLYFLPPSFSLNPLNMEALDLWRVVGTAGFWIGGLHSLVLRAALFHREGSQKELWAFITTLNGRTKTDPTNKRGSIYGALL